MFFFFFSSRRRHTRFKCDWSSDVCSSDLANNGSVSDLWVTVEYFDEGTNSFRLEYDAQPDPSNINPDTDSLTVASGGRIFTYDSKQWLSHTFVLQNVFFGKRQPGSSDFRIDDWTID